MPKPNAQTLSEAPRFASPFSRRLIVFGGIGLLLALLAGAAAADWWYGLPPDAVATATFVGRDRCITCHQKEASAFAGSDHDRAMDHATPETVLGNFDNAEFTHHGMTSKMFRKGKRYMIHTEGPDGNMADFEVKFVFGVRPLQQYMVEFDRPADMPENEIARLQVLRISWDTEKKEWFYLPPPDVDEKLSPDDDLHWTGIAQRWNNMCADCHSTNLKKNYDHAAQTYHTQYSEIDVSCEACHGPGSTHIKLANAWSPFWDRQHGYGLAKLKGEDSHAEIETCAACHSRRRVLHADARPRPGYYDDYANELLQPATYHCDGQIKDEVYVYGSFIQSKMYHKGIRCTDCHDPHTTRLKFEGNKVCTSCHEHPAGKYDTPAHHRHTMGTKGASCVECHMPETTYMEVDPRRDHSLRVPRPDLSVKLGVPNACTGCHLPDAKLPEEKTKNLHQYADWLLAREQDDEIDAALKKLDAWSAKHAAQWRGDKEPAPHFAEELNAVWNEPAEAQAAFVDLATRKTLPAIVRGSALAAYPAGSTEGGLAIARKELQDRNPQVRMAALGTYEYILPSRNDLQDLRPSDWPQVGTNIAPIMQELIPLLSDPQRIVRIEAARVLSRVPRELLPDITDGNDRAKLKAAIAEYEASLLVSNDRAGAHVMLGMLHENQGDDDLAIKSYQVASRVEPAATGARSNLAALHDRLARSLERKMQQLAVSRQREEAEKLIPQVVEHRQKADALRAEELPLIARDVRLAPQIVELRYRYAMALYTQQKLEEAEQELLKTIEQEPEFAQGVLALALLYQKQEKWNEADKYIDRLLELRPDDVSYQNLQQDIRQRKTEN